METLETSLKSLAKSVDVFQIFSQIYSEDVKFRTILFLCKNNAASIRQIARHVGISHKNLAAYLDYLESKGIAKVLYNKPNMKLYGLSDKASLLRNLLKQV